jgi:hypothetical protein
VQLFGRDLPASGMEVQRLSGTVTRDEQAVVFPVDAAPLRHAAALSRLAVQVTRSLLRFQANEMDASSSAIEATCACYGSDG